jgi:hypothetical protein
MSLSASAQDALVVNVLTAPANAFIQKVAVIVVELLLKLPKLVEPWLQQAKQEALSHVPPQVGSSGAKMGRAECPVS